MHYATLLQVASEDTVLYTAQQYVDNQPESCSKDAKSKLAPLVRCPHLSHFWLSASVASSDAPKLLLSELRPQLRHLLLAQRPGLTNDITSTAVMKSEKLGGLSTAPASWLLPARKTKEVSSVQLQWVVELSAIKAAAVEAATSKKAKMSCAGTSAPLQGIVWGLSLEVASLKNRGIEEVTVYLQPSNIPADTYCKPAHRVDCAPHQEMTPSTTSYPAGGMGCPTSNASRVCFSRKAVDIFSGMDRFGWAIYEIKSGGSDEVAWAAYGLPTSGQLVVKLTIGAT